MSKKTALSRARSKYSHAYFNQLEPLSQTVLLAAALPPWMGFHLESSPPACPTPWIGCWNVKIAARLSARHARMDIGQETADASTSLLIRATGAWPGPTAGGRIYVCIRAETRAAVLAARMQRKQPGSETRPLSSGSIIFSVHHLFFCFFAPILRIPTLDFDATSWHIITRSIPYVACLSTPRRDYAFGSDPGHYGAAERRGLRFERQQTSQRAMERACMICGVSVMDGFPSSMIPGYTFRNWSRSI